MADILEEIINHKRKEVENYKKELSPSIIHIQVEALMTSRVPSFSKALTDSDTGIIAELKRKSPSKGWINEHCDVDKVISNYASAGAAAVSILTDEKFFGGSHAYMVMASRKKLGIPMLYKNFIIDEYQLYQARRSGASAVLLIAACLSKSECKALIEKTHQLGMEVLLEMHSEEELEYAELEPDMYGINNRNLGTFITDVQNSYRLAELLPRDAVKVSESGISNPKTVRELRNAGFKGFLIGETFMKTEDPGKALKNFIDRI